MVQLKREVSNHYSLSLYIKGGIENTNPLPPMVVLEAPTYNIW